jgi:surfactin synthase thioesterase subunit
VARGRFKDPTLVSLASPDEEPELDLFLLPGAGAGPRSFSGWAGSVPPSWRVTAACLPGRDRRTGEPFVTSMAECADLLAAATRELDRPLVLLGHSLGGMLAFEVAKRVPVVTVFTVGSSPPDRVVDTGGGSDEMIDRTVREMLRNAGVPDSPVLDDLVDVVSPIMRADLEMAHSCPAPEPRGVACDIVSYYGSADAMPALSWQPFTTAHADLVVYEGDHHAVHTDVRWFVADMAYRLATRGTPGSVVWDHT